MIAATPHLGQFRVNSWAWDVPPVPQGVDAGPRIDRTKVLHFAPNLRGFCQVSEQGAVPMIVLTRSQDHVEAINSTLRKAGHPVHCTWLSDASDLGDALTQLNPEMLIAFMDELSADLASVMKVKQQNAPGMPVLIVRENVDEAAIAEAMRLGCQDEIGRASCRERV